MGRPLRIAIIGGGIGGLTLASALRQRGIDAEIYEQAAALAEIGAAVALSANSTRELRRLGVLDAVTAVSTEPSELIFRNWRDGSRIAAHDVHNGLRYQNECGAPYFGVHRADLQRILSGALGGAGFYLGHQLTGITDQGGAIGLTFAAELLGREAPRDLASLRAHYETLRRARTLRIQRSSWVTNRLLHLPDGSELADRDRRVSRFPDDFGWIHQFDALTAARHSLFGEKAVETTGASTT